MRFDRAIKMKAWDFAATDFASGAGFRLVAVERAMTHRRFARARSGQLLSS
jgi:hypothetical protein